MLAIVARPPTIIIYETLGSPSVRPSSRLGRHWLRSSLRLYDRLMTYSPVCIAYLICLLLCLGSSLAAETCSKELYGAPSSFDCDALLQAIADITDGQARIFDEEQLRTPGGLVFPGVKNIYSTPIFQTPAYWSFRLSLPLSLYLAEHKTMY